MPRRRVRLNNEFPSWLVRVEKGAVLLVSEDLLQGVEAIASYIGISVRQVRYARERGALPVRHKDGFGIYALKSELLDSLRDDDSLPSDRGCES